MRRRLTYGAMGVFLCSCAQVVAPTGGPRDTSPPMVRNDQTVPVNNSTRFGYKQITLVFNEYIRQQPGRQVVVSPPLPKQPVIQIKGKKAIIDLPGELAPNTTYTMNFSGMFADITEGNILEDYVYVFSTGDFLDSGQVTGRLVNAVTRSSFVKGWALLYPDTGDFTQPAYLARSDKGGNFSISHIKPGTYRLRALADINNNLRYDLISEWTGFADEEIYVDGNSHAVDPVYLFKEYEKEFRVRRQVANSGLQFQVFFNRIIDSLSLRPLNRPGNFTGYDIMPGDSSVYLMFGSVVKDTAFFEMASHGRIDTFYILPERNAKHVFKMEAPGIQHLMPLEKIELRVNAPARLDTALIEITDTLHNKRLTAENASDGRIPAFTFAHSDDLYYRVVLKKGAVADATGLFSDSCGFYVRWLPPEKYGTLKITYTLPEKWRGQDWVLELFRPAPAFSDTLHLHRDSGAVQFNALRPGTYLLRGYVDWNKDNRWTTGNMENEAQPEPLFPYGQSIQVRANWDMEINWKPE